ncbi:putative Protein kinase domain containing protein [Blattamonas nauphoetae]|uniref:Protein kinase domain-containing protein n=1 Tax=Blattamonas nauphoetae TaxID=2049346 RepID=A0ABQ9WWT2_9EUKA|nr:putative Protein kinase domain containing protein [Blattamonas nauphoetae]
MEDYSILEKLGDGRSSTCYSARKKHTLQIVCVKVYPKTKKAEISRSIKLIRDILHPNITKIKDWFETNGHIWVIQEYCTGGSLSAVLKSNDRFTEPNIRALSLDMRAAIQNPFPQELQISPRWSPEFRHLLTGLLCKSPTKRLGWPALGYHPFWTETLFTREMPPQPSFDRLAAALTEHENSDSSLSSSCVSEESSSPDFCSFTKSETSQTSNSTDRTQVSVNTSSHSGPSESLSSSHHSLFHEFLRGRHSADKTEQSLEDSLDPDHLERPFTVFDSNVIWNEETDLPLTPIALNKKIEQVAIPIVDVNRLPSALQPFAQQIPNGNVDCSELARIMEIQLQHCSHPGTNDEMTNLLSLLISLSENHSVSSALLQPAIVQPLLSLFSSISTSPGNHQMIALLFSRLFRFSSTFPASLFQTDMIDVLLHSAASDTCHKTRRWALAAVGELFFFVCFLPETSRTTDITDSTPNFDENHVIDQVVRLLQNVLTSPSDSISAHYAAKTIENIVTLPVYSPHTPHSTRDLLIRSLTTPAIASALAGIFVSATEPELRSTALSTIARLVRLKLDLSRVVMSFIGLDTLAVHFITSPLRALRIAAANLLLMILSAEPTFNTPILPSDSFFSPYIPTTPFPTSFIAYVHSPPFVDGLKETLTSQPTTISSKVLLLVSALLHLYPAFTARLSEGCLSDVFKLFRRHTKYSRQSFEVFVTSLCPVYSLAVESAAVFLTSPLATLNLPFIAPTLKLHTLSPELTQRIEIVTKTLIQVQRASVSPTCQNLVLSPQFIVALSSIITGLITPRKNTVSVSPSFLWSNSVSPGPDEGPGQLPQTTSIDRTQFPASSTLTFHLPEANKTTLIQLTLDIAGPLVQNKTVLSKYITPISTNLLPSFFFLVIEKSSDLRFWGIKAISDAVTEIFDQTVQLRTKLAEEKNVLEPHLKEFEQAASHLLTLIELNLVSNYRSLFMDADPIPLYVLKIFASAVKYDSHFVSVLLRSGVVRSAVSHFTPSHPANNIHNMTIVLCVLSSGLLSVKDIEEMEVVQKVVVMMTNTINKQIVMFCEIMIEILYSVLFLFVSPPPSTPLTTIRSLLMPLIDTVPSVVRLLAFLFDDSSILYCDFTIADVATGSLSLMTKHLLSHDRSNTKRILSVSTRRYFLYIFERLSHFLSGGLEDYISVIGLRRTVRALLHLTIPIEDDPEHCALMRFKIDEIQNLIQSLEIIGQNSPLTAQVTSVITELKTFLK